MGVAVSPRRAAATPTLNNAPPRGLLPISAVKRPLVLASLLASAALAGAPAVAPAQDAGGSQYVDPVPSTPTGTTQTPTTSSPAPTTSSTTSGSATASSTGTTTSTQAAAAGTAGNPGIPRTGFPAVWLVFAGALALASGIALRRAAGLVGS